MNRPYTHRRLRSRRGVIIMMVAFFMVVMLGLIAFALDLGYIVLTRTQLQTAADAAALAAGGSSNLDRADMEVVAKQFAASNTAAGRPAQLASADIEYGSWDISTRTFTPSSAQGNAVRVTTRSDQTPLFFARIFGMDSVRQQASAVATLNPRDIAFVVDLSGTMNNDTEPANTGTLNSSFASQGYPTIGSDLLNQVYADFGFNATYPNEPVQWIGRSLGVSGSGDPLSTLMSIGGLLSKSSIPSKYRIKSTDSSSTRKKKAYSWAMDVQIPLVMPGVKPTPNSSTNYSYWAAYFDYYYRQIGCRSYVQFMMDYGRDDKPDGVNYVPLSRFSPDCPLHAEATAGGTFSFPPREQPTHAARRALIAAIKLIKDRNENISDMNQRDWVSIIAFDSLSNGGPVIQVSLTGDYDAAMQACTQLQACSDHGYSTATEAGLITARSHLQPSSSGGSGRRATDKIVVLLTDGQPNLYVTPQSQINQYMRDHPSSYFFGTSGDPAHNAPLMQTSMMQGDHWYLYPVGIGLDCDYAFMDSMASMGTTADQNHQSPRGSGNPADYEARLMQIFQNIITNPKLRLVQ